MKDRGSSLAKISSQTVFELAKKALYEWEKELATVNKRLEDSKEKFNQQNLFFKMCNQWCGSYKDYVSQEWCEEQVVRAENLMRISSHTEEPVYLTPSDGAFLRLTRDG